MNKVILMGRLTRDPEVRYSQGGSNMAIARFSIAVDRRIRRDGQPTADFFNCTAFGRTAEFVEKYFKKGNRILVDGEIQNDNYQGKDGNMVYGMQIIVNNVEFCESKGSQSGFDGGFAPVQGGAVSAPAPAGDDFMNIPDGIDEELPFN